MPGQRKEEHSPEDTLWGCFHPSPAAFPMAVLLCFLLQRNCSRPRGRRTQTARMERGPHGKDWWGCWVLSSASHFYFWLIFLASGWLDIFCRDPPCFSMEICHHLSPAGKGVYFLKIDFYCRIVTLQCCVSFYCTAKWISHKYIRPFPLELPSHPGHHGVLRRVHCAV